MSLSRRCTRTACGRPAVATLTYVYADSTAVLGPLATYAEPHCYDLCALHAVRLTGPRGWDIVRLDPGLLTQADALTDPDALSTSGDDLTALVDAVREPARAVSAETEQRSGVLEIGRRGHLRVLRSPEA